MARSIGLGVAQTTGTSLMRHSTIQTIRNLPTSKIVIFGRVRHKFTKNPL
jgi:hypothetical protein